MDLDERMKHRRQLRLESIRGYIDKVLLPVLKYRGTITVKPALFGRNSYVYFLERSNLEPLVLRCEENKSCLMRRIRGHYLLLRHGFDVPGIVYQDLDPLVHRKFGFYFMVETFISGKHFLSEAHDTVAAGTHLGAVLARMHEFTSWRHGWPGEWCWPGSVFGGLSLRWKTRSKLEAYRKRNRMSSDTVGMFLNKQHFSAWFPRPRLTTGGYISSNLLVDKDRVSIIDLARVRYAFAPRDIAQVHVGLTRNDKQARFAFFKSYRQHASKTLLTEIDRTLPLFEVLFLLRLALNEPNVDLYEKRDQELLKYCKI